MGQQKSPKELLKFLFYILGVRPDEFGLVPDSQGYVKIKDLLKAIHEERGWGYVQKAAIDEVMLTIPNPPLETDDARIRAKDRQALPQIAQPGQWPKLLFTCIRSKAHPVVEEKGLSPLGGFPHVILSSEKEMAERMGRRIDPFPITAIVNVQQAQTMGVEFQAFGETLFLSPFIPPGCFTVPPLPKVKPEISTVSEPRKEPKTPGSFLVDLPSFDQNKKKQLDRRKKEMTLGKERKRQRQQKHKMFKNEE